MTSNYFDPTGAYLETSTMRPGMQFRHTRKWLDLAFAAAGLGDAPTGGNRGTEFLAAIAAVDPADIAHRATEALATARDARTERKIAEAAVAELARQAALYPVNGRPAGDELRVSVELMQYRELAALVPPAVEKLRPAFARTVDELATAAKKLPQGDHPLDADAVTKLEDADAFAALLTARDCLKRLAALTPRRPRTKYEVQAPEGYLVAATILAFDPKPERFVEDVRPRLTGDGWLRRKPRVEELDEARKASHLTADEIIVKAARGDFGDEYTLDPEPAAAA